MRPLPWQHDDERTRLANATVAQDDIEGMQATAMATATTTATARMTTTGRPLPWRHDDDELLRRPVPRWYNVVINNDDKGGTDAGASQCDDNDMTCMASVMAAQCRRGWERTRVPAGATIMTMTEGMNMGTNRCDNNDNDDEMMHMASTTATLH